MNNQLYENYTKSILLIDQIYYMIDQINNINEETFNIVQKYPSHLFTDFDSIYKFYFKLDDIVQLFKYELVSNGTNSIEINIYKIDEEKFQSVIFTEDRVSICNIKFIIDQDRTPVISHSYVRHNDEAINSVFSEYIDKMNEICKKVSRRHKALLTNMVSDTENYTQTPIDDAIDSLNMNTAYIISGDFVEESITLDEFLKLELDDVNYNNTVYRITNDEMLPVLKEFFKNVFMLGKFHRFDNVKSNRLFYIENCDLQDIQEVLSDNIYNVKEEGYKFVNIIY